jgi:hypothetical protein
VNHTAIADDAAPQQQNGDKKSCNGGSCKGDEAGAKTDAGAAAGDKKSCKGAAGKKKAKHKAKKKAAPADSNAAAPSGG